MRRQFPHDHLRTRAKKSTKRFIPIGQSGFNEVAGSGAVTSGRLRFVGGAANVTLQVASPLAELCRAAFTGPAPAVCADEGIVTLIYLRGGDPANWLQSEAVITLNGALAWEIEFESVANLNAALTGLHLRALDVTESVSGSQVTLPYPTGIVYIHVAGSVSHLQIQRPVGVAVRLVTRQAVTALTLDDRHVAAASKELFLESDGSQQVDNRYDIEVAGNANDLTITTEVS